MQLTQKVIDILIKIREYPSGMTKKEQNTFDDVRFYIMTNYLQGIGLAYCNGVGEHNLKKWKLTTKGERIADHLKQIMDIYYDREGKDGKKKG